MRFLLTPLARTPIASRRLFVSAVDLFRMEPHNEMLSDRTSNEAYCLAEPAKAPLIRSPSRCHREFATCELSGWSFVFYEL